MPTDVKITTDLLYKAALVFALMDAIYIPLLVWRVRAETFRRMKWSLFIAAALVWYGIWAWAIGNFWEPVYSYVFPVWAQTWVHGCLCSCRHRRTRLVDDGNPFPVETCCHILPDEWGARKHDAHLGCISRHRHQTAHFTRCFATGGSHYRFF